MLHYWQCVLLYLNYVIWFPSPLTQSAYYPLYLSFSGSGFTSSSGHPNETHPDGHIRGRPRPLQWRESPDLKSSIQEARIVALAIWMAKVSGLEALLLLKQLFTSECWFLGSGWMGYREFRCFHPYHLGALLFRLLLKQSFLWFTYYCCVFKIIQ